MKLIIMGASLVDYFNFKVDYFPICTNIKMLEELGCAGNQRHPPSWIELPYDNLVWLQTASSIPPVACSETGQWHFTVTPISPAAR